MNAENKKKEIPFKVFFHEPFENEKRSHVICLLFDGRDYLKIELNSNLWIKIEFCFVFFFILFIIMELKSNLTFILLLILFKNGNWLSGVFPQDRFTEFESRVSSYLSISTFSNLNIILRSWDRWLIGMYWIKSFGLKQ